MPDETVNRSSHFLSPACLSQSGTRRELRGWAGSAEEGEGAQVARMAQQPETDAASMRLAS